MSEFLDAGWLSGYNRDRAVLRISSFQAVVGDRGSVVRRIICALALAGVSCSDARLPVQPTASGVSSSSNPAAAASSGPGQAIVSFMVSGTVRDTLLNSLADVSVEIVDGPMSGTSVRTDARGQFRFAEAFTDEASLRAVSNGYSSVTTKATRPSANSGRPEAVITFTLPASAPSADISGAYTFTVGTTPACDAIPESLRTRSYDVVLAPHSDPYTFRMNFVDPNVVDSWNPTIVIRLKGSQMQMTIGDWEAGIIEDVPDGWLTFFGIAQAGVSDSGTSGSFLENGSDYRFCPGARPNKGTHVTTWDCTAPQYSWFGAACPRGFHYALTRR
jgi:hypothetical protein